MVELCAVCGEALDGEVAPVMTEDGWTHLECVDEEDFEALIAGLVG